MFAPDCVRKSALPDLLEIALLPCLVILAPAAAATKDEAVEQLKVCKPVPPVPQVSTVSYTHLTLPTSSWV